MIYFIRAGYSGPVKIGTAVDVRGRRSILQCAHYEQLTVVRQIEGGREGEAWLHQQFKELRIRGDWFHFDERMLAIEVPQDLPPNVIQLRPGPKGGFSDIIRLWPNRMAFARAIGVQYTTANAMYQRNSIAGKYFSDVVRGAKGIGHPEVTHERLASLAESAARGSGA
jgi:hypothetical protein